MDTLIKNNTLLKHAYRYWHPTSGTKFRSPTKFWWYSDSDEEAHDKHKRMVEKLMKYPRILAQKGITLADCRTTTVDDDIMADLFIRHSCMLMQGGSPLSRYVQIGSYNVNCTKCSLISFISVQPLHCVPDDYVNNVIDEGKDHWNQQVEELQRRAASSRRPF